MELPGILNKRPLIISGPCSAETRDQVLTTIKEIAALNKVDIIRAGIWKPRTKPGNFEGIGEPGLSWLIEASEVTGLPVMVEVANPRHVELILKYNIPIVWIGARTTVNPFYVQELAEALKGTDVKVFIKNPINAEIELWSGAVERFLAVNSYVGMIHRGFSLYGNEILRNPPMWNIPIEMKRRFPNVTMVCDPSHICGNRTQLKYVSQTAIDLGMDGLMIESHIQPDAAWSDARQQITPTELKALLDNLIWRSPDPQNAQHHSILHALRQEIDKLDKSLLELLSNRMQLAEQIGAYKKSNNITIVQMERFNDILRNGLDRARELGLSEHFIRSYFDVIHMESIDHQNRVMND